MRLAIVAEGIVQGVGYPNPNRSHEVSMAIWQTGNTVDPNAEKIGWIGAKRPRMVAVQATGCAPIVRAWEQGEEHAPLWQNAATVAAGIRVPVAVGDFLIIRAVRESNGFGIAVDDDDIIDAQKEMACEEGLLLCPEGAATYAAYRRALSEGLISRKESAVLFNCATGLKYPMPKAEKFIDRTKPIDWSQFK